MRERRGTQGGGGAGGDAGSHARAFCPGRGGGGPLGSDRRALQSESLPW